MSHEQGINVTTTPNNPSERLLTILHNTLASTPWAQEMFAQASVLQKDFFRYAARPDVGRSEADHAYDETLGQLSGMTRVQVKEGEEYARRLKDAPAIIVATNHLGIGGVGYVDNSDGTFDYPRDKIEGFPLGMLPGFLISKWYTGGLQTDIRGEDRGDLISIRKKLSGIVIPNSANSGRTEKVISEINQMRGPDKRHVFLLFPEGRPSGWANNGGPYDLDTFRAGTFVIACKTGLPILPICQYFDPQRGLDLFVLPPIQLGQEDLAQVGLIKDATQQAMQTVLSAASGPNYLY